VLAFFILLKQTRCMNKVRPGILGTGNLGKRHAE